MYSKYEKGIKQEEIDFPKQFASYEEKEYGILFYMAIAGSLIFPVCRQWAGSSEHICYPAGFRKAFTMEAGFAELAENIR